VTVEQVPMEPVMSHAWHCPPQLLLQQTPSAQWPERHWSPAVQVAPRLPCGMHVGALHQLPAVHCPSTVQVVKQAVAPQT
jgi:hypothetical protein